MDNAASHPDRVRPQRAAVRREAERRLLPVMVASTFGDRELLDLERLGRLLAIWIDRMAGMHRASCDQQHRENHKRQWQTHAALRDHGRDLGASLEASHRVCPFYAAFGSIHPTSTSHDADSRAEASRIILTPLSAGSRNGLRDGEDVPFVEGPLERGPTMPRGAESDLLPGDRRIRYLGVRRRWRVWARPTALQGGPPAGQRADRYGARPRAKISAHLR